MACTLNSLGGRIHPLIRQILVPCTFNSFWTKIHPQRWMVFGLLIRRADNWTSSNLWKEPIGTWKSFVEKHGPIHRNFKTQTEKRLVANPPPKIWHFQWQFLFVLIIVGVGCACWLFAVPRNTYQRDPRGGSVQVIVKMLGFGKWGWTFLDCFIWILIYMYIIKKLDVYFAKMNISTFLQILHMPPGG